MFNKIINICNTDCDSGFGEINRMNIARQASSLEHIDTNTENINNSISSISSCLDNQTRIEALTAAYNAKLISEIQYKNALNLFITNSPLRNIYADTIFYKEIKDISIISWFEKKPKPCFDYSFDSDVFEELSRNDRVKKNILEDDMIRKEEIYFKNVSKQPLKEISNYRDINAEYIIITKETNKVNPKDLFYIAGYPNSRIKDFYLSKKIDLEAAYSFEELETILSYPFNRYPY